MFFIHPDIQTITLHPSFLGPRVNDQLKRKLLEEVEGTIKEDYYIICVIDITSVPEGRVVPGTGQAEYQIEYRAVIWKPFKGEILDGSVTSVMSSGFFVEVGPMQVFISKSMMSPDFYFDANSTPPQFVDVPADMAVNKGSQVRFKIFGVRTEVGNIFILGTIKGDYLGTIEGVR